MLDILATLDPNNPLVYCILGLATMVEGPITLLVGGATASQGLLLPLPVYLSCVTGNLIADMCWYGFGRFGKPEWFVRFSSKLRIDPGKIEQLQKGIQKHAPHLIFLAKLTVGFPIPILIATGLNRVPPYRWVGLLILGELIKSAAFVTVGYLYAEAIQQTASNIQGILWSITAVIILTILIWFKRNGKKNR
jgi:membrane protein DedA with SNARE-associated domain